LWTPSTYVREGIRNGLREWRENGWQWEYFGRLVPVKNDDLWKRLDRAMEFHQVDCRTWRVDPAHGPKVASPQCEAEPTAAEPDSAPPDSSRIDQIREKLGEWKASIGRCVIADQGSARLAENS
jgi:ribonuclease HI